MFYRRKILLSLIETFGGSLSRTDTQKLVFLFCNRTGRNYYDFFPYQYGGFSYVLNNDKRHLTTKGYLSAGEKIILKEPFLDKTIKELDLIEFQNIKNEVGTLRGEKLIKKIYKEFPYYASNSKIVSEILSSPELETINRHREKNETPCLFTIGYEGKSIDLYLNELHKKNIKALVDVRKNPISRKFGFSKSKLKAYVERLDIMYFHLPGLGIPKQLRTNLVNIDSYKKLFALYRATILPEQLESIELLNNILLSNNRIALTCFEADHQFCHRSEIITYMQSINKLNTPVIHIN